MFRWWWWWWWWWSVVHVSVSIRCWRMSGKWVRGWGAPYSLLGADTSPCVLCPKAGPADDDAIWSSAQLFSSTPRIWSSCPIDPWVDPTSSFLVFLGSVFLPSSPLVQDMWLKFRLNNYHRYLCPPCWPSSVLSILPSMLLSHSLLSINLLLSVFGSAVQRILLYVFSVCRDYDFRYTMYLLVDEYLCFTSIRVWTFT